MVRRGYMWQKMEGVRLCAKDFLAEFSQEVFKEFDYHHNAAMKLYNERLRAKHDKAVERIFVPWHVRLWRRLFSKR